MKHLYNLLIFITIFPIFAQEEKPITTAFPFLLLSTDATASGMGDIGLCSSPNVFSQRWNAAKYVFAEATSGVGVGYSPYLNKLAKDVFLGNITYYKRLRRSAWGASFTYFTIGEVALTQNIGSNAYLAGNVRPSEFAADLSYNLKLSEQFAMGVATRYLQSALRLPSEGNTTARSIAFDISGYYTSREHPIGNAWGYYTWGFQLSNIGAKVKYEDLGKEYFIPTNLKIGASYNLLFSELHSISLLVEANKLLVPSVPEDNEDFLQGIFKSFSDAPNGFSEEWHEISKAIGVQYAYNQQFFVRMAIIISTLTKATCSISQWAQGLNTNHSNSIFLIFSLQLKHIILSVQHSKLHYNICFEKKASFEKSARVEYVRNWGAFF